MFRLYDIIYDNCLFRQFKVNELLFVEYKCLNDEQKLIVLAKQHFFMHILGGKKIWRTLQSTYEATSGQTVFVKKGASIVHQFYDNEFCAVIIFIPDQFIIDFIQHSHLTAASIQNNQPSDSVMLLNDDAVLTAYFQSVFSYFGQEAPPATSLLEHKFRELLLYMLTSTKNPELTAYLFSLCQTNKTCIREMMEKNCIYNIRLEEFAKMSGRSLASFKREFADIFKTSPGKWLMHQKLQYAKQLLDVSDKNISELAFDAGFESPSHFIRLFKSQYQTTPLRYKKMRAKKLLPGD